MSGNGNGKGKIPQVSISTLVKTTFQGGDPYSTISQLLERKPTGVLTLQLQDGGIRTVEWTERTLQK